jgi:hypothetical protein
MAAYYVDLDAPTDGSGTFASPWNTPESVESAGLADGSEVYFKCGTTFTYSGDLHAFSINFSGTSSVNRSIIGAYYDDGGSPENTYATVKSQIDLAVEDYPEINGPLDFTTYCQMTNWAGLVHVNSGEDNLYIDNLRIQHATGYGVKVDATLPTTSSYVDVRHNYFYDIWVDAVGFFHTGVSNCKAYDCFADLTSQRVYVMRFTSCSAWPTHYAHGFAATNSCNTCEFSNNVLRRCMGEALAIGGFGDPRAHSIVCHSNIVEAARSNNCYANGTNQQVYNNIFIGSTATVPGTSVNYHRTTNGGSGYGIGFSNEGNTFPADTGTVVWNNLIAWCAYAFFVNCNTNSGQSPEFTIYHNTCVDNGYGNSILYVTQINGSWASGYPIVKNNIFVNYTDNFNLDTLVNSVAGNYGTWDYNCWYIKYNNKTLPESQGCRGANDVGADPLLNRSTGFYNQIDTYEDATDTDWNILVGSPCDDACVKLTGYETDYYGTTRDA